MGSRFSKRPAVSHTAGRSLLLADGPWEHLTVNAAGADFHLAATGPIGGEPIILLHPYPRTWYAWHRVLPALGEAGYRAFSMDLRGFGTSDLQPYGQDPLRMSADVAAVISSLGYPSAHIGGAGLGGTLGWILAATHPEIVDSFVTVAAPHPLSIHGTWPFPTTRAGRAVARTRLPWLNIRALRSGALIKQTTAAWAAPSNIDKVARNHRVYAYAFSRPYAARLALKAIIRANALTAHTRKRIDTIIQQPVTAIIGQADPLRPPATFLRDQQWVHPPITSHLVPGSGHFVTEEAPDVVTDHLIAHLTEHSTRQ